MTNAPIDTSILAKLSDKEREVALKVLQELYQGDTSSYDDLKYNDYKEIPVDISTFIKDTQYLGKAWHLPGGKCKLFPYWEKRLNELFPDNITTSVNNAIFSGARGLGKSEIAVTCMLYLMYRIMCLKNPYEFYNLKTTEKFAFAFMNITEALAVDIGISKFQSTVQASPWFMERGTITGKNTLIWNPPNCINIIIGSQPRHVIGQPIFGAFFDEISFIANQDIEQQKAKAIDMIDTAIGGMATRFTYKGSNPTLLCLASSKRSEKSFLEVHTKKKLESEGDNLLLVDEPVWNVRPAEEYSGKKFYVAQGNKYLASEVIPDGAETKPYTDKGYKVLEVPIEYRAKFLDDIDRALCDYAGVSSSDITKYIAGWRWGNIKKPELKNPFAVDVLKIGNGPEDKAQYYDAFDLSKVDPRMKSKPLYIHLDMSISGDRTGIAGVWILRKKPSQEGRDTSKELYCRLAFSIAIEAPKGFQVSFEKNRQFIYWLKSQGFNIKGVSSDTFQSADLAQQLASKGYNYTTISVDRVDTLEDKSKICRPYHNLQSFIYEERLEVYDSELLTTEILGLEKNSNGKIDHPDGGKSGCFTGDTKVSLVDGRDLTLVELVEEFNRGKKNYVYSFNEKTKKIEPKLIEKAWCTLKNASLVEVLLDNGEKLRCTPNHLFMLRDGVYCEAQNLKKDDSLMPLYRKYPSKDQSPMGDYRLYYEPIEDKWHYEHRRFCEEILSDSKQIVHHKNCNKKDNSPSNLIYCSKKEHQGIHAKMCTGAHSPQAKSKKSKAITKWHEDAKGTEVYIIRSKKLHDANLRQHGRTEEDYLEHQNKMMLQRLNGERLRENAKKAQQEREEYIRAIENLYNVCWKDLSASEKDSYSVKFHHYNHPESLKAMGDTISAKHACGDYKNAKTALARCNEESKKLKELCPKVDLEKFFNIFGFDYSSLAPRRRASWVTKYRKIVCKEILNHRVVSVKFLDYTEDVYDLTVQDNHNFALASGVFVHNSKDIADAVCGSLWNASQNGDQFAVDFGESLDATVNANNDSPYSQQQITIDLEKELNDIFGNFRSNKDNNSKDFGMGKAVPVSVGMDGIIVI